MVWEYPNNFSNGTMVSDLGTLVQYGSYVTHGFLATGFLLIIFLMVFGINAMRGSRVALLSASFITFIFSIYFMRLDLVPNVIPFTLGIATGITLILSMKQ